MLKISFLTIFQNTFLFHPASGDLTRRSSVSAHIRVTDDWSHALDEGHEVCIFFDVWKGFDRVPHQLLLQQLHLDPRGGQGIEGHGPTPQH